MAQCNFNADNGQPSLLYGALEQKYGSEKATKIWNWTKSPGFPKVDERDANGEPSLDAVERALATVGAITDRTVEGTTVSEDAFNMNSEGDLAKSIGAFYDMARANPATIYTVPFDFSEIILVGKKRMDPARFAALFDGVAVPSNVKFMEPMNAQMENLPKRFLSNMAIEGPDGLSIDPAERKKQQDAIFIPIKNVEHKPTGEYFSPELESEVVDAIIFKFYNLVNQLQNDPNLAEKLEGKSMKSFVRQRIFDDLSAMASSMRDIADGKSKKVAPTEAHRELANTLQQVLNSYYTRGDKGNNFWKSAMTKLESFGVTMRDTTELNPTDIPESMVMNDSDLFNMEEGMALRDFSDSSFEIDLKNTASTRLKMFLMSTVESQYGDEIQPKNISLLIANADTRRALQRGTKRELILDPALVKAQGITPLSQLSTAMSQTERDARSMRTAVVDGKVMRITALAPLTQDQVNRMADRIQLEEGKTPQVGDVYAKVEPYEAKENQLRPVLNFMRMPRLADYESLFQQMTGILANKEPNYQSYVEALKAAKSANLDRVVEKLESSGEHIKKEFVSVMSSTYQRQLMALFRKGQNGLIEGRVFDSNRSSEVQMLQSRWQEGQKLAAIFTRDAAGRTVVNQEIAAELWNELQTIYAIPKPRKPMTFAETERAYGKQATAEWNRMSKEVEDQFRQIDARKKVLLNRFLEVNGIDMDPRAIEDLEKYIGKSSGQITTLFGGFSADGKPIGLIDVLIARQYSGANMQEDTSEESDMNDETDAYKANNPLYTENSAVAMLARAQLRYETSVYSNTHRSGDGKTIYGFGLNTATSHAVRKLVSDQSYRDMLAKSHYAKTSWLLDRLNTDNVMRDKFELVYMDSLKNEYGFRDGVTRPEMSDREQWITMLTYYQNRGNSYANYISLTHSDKTKTPVFRNAPRLRKVMTVLNGDRLAFSPTTLETVFNTVFMAEYNRMTQPGGENIKGYANGKKHYYALPMFNKSAMKQMLDAQTITQAEYNSIWNNDEPGSPTNTLFKPTAFKLINMQLRQMTTDTRKSWEDSGLLVVGVPGSESYISRLYTDAGLANEWKKDNPGPAITLAAADYTVNSFLFNVSLSQVLYGDPALTFKGDVPKTLVEYGKRLAKDIAPGRDGEFSHSPTYKSLTVQDYEPAAKELAGLRGYDAVAATDAQEITTVEEHLDVLYAYGKITQAQWTRGKEVIAKAKNTADGYYEFDENLALIIMQPMKPVYAGFDAPVDGVLNYNYIKTSSFPLYPPMVKGMELDKLRRQMEKTGLARLVFSSGQKIGAPKNMPTLFTAAGNINESAFKSVEWAPVQLDRSGFRIQQEVPYDETKDAILTVSQMDKLVVEKIPTIQKAFMYKGNEVNGTELRAIKEDLRSRMVTAQHEEFLERVGAYVNQNGDMVFRDKSKFYKLLAEEAKNGEGYTINDVLALTSINSNGELEVPIMFLPSASKMESSMMSLIKDIVKVKMPGHSFIQASPAGMKTVQTWENTDLDKNQIVWTKPMNGELTTAHIGEDGSVVPAQIIVGFNYFINGQRIAISDYMQEVDGRKMLNTEKLPKELFQLVGARIPNQGHSSMLPIEIVGFLPQTMGDIVIVPSAITKQMGADFDVDKLYTYHREYENTDDGLRTAESVKNDYFDVHWSVLTNPDMFTSMMALLDKPDAANEAKLLNDADNKAPFYFSPLYQMSDFQSMKGAKVMVGITSLALTHNAVIQDKNIYMATFEENEQGEIVEVPTGITINLNGKAVTLTHLSGYGESNYEGVRRTKADNIQIQQSESVDHAKNRIIDKLNLDPNTAAASLAISRLQTADGDTPGIAVPFAFNARLLMQPAVREFAKRLSMMGDTLTGGAVRDVRTAVIDQLLAEYESELDAGQIVAFPIFSPELLLENVKKNDPYIQYHALKLFQQFDDIGQAIVTLQSTMAQDTRGAGGDVLSALKVAENRTKVGVSASGIVLSGLNEVFTGQVETMYNATIETALDAYQEDFPYEKLTPFYEAIGIETGKGDNGFGIPNSTKEAVFNGIRSFIFSGSQLGLYSDASTERARLLFTTKAGPSLAKRVQAAQRGWGKNNYFLQRLSVNIDPDGLHPDMVEYNAAKAGRLDDFLNTKTWISMLETEGEQKELAEDLVRYIYATGGLQSARNFAKFIPWSVFSGTQMGFALKNAASQIENIAESRALLEQILQHNPSMAKQLSGNLIETGMEFDIVPSSFTLPPVSENMDSPLIIQRKLEGKTVTTYPDYLSVYDNTNKVWKLFKHRQSPWARSLYTQIDTLGFKTMLEYNRNAEGEVRSMETKNRSPFYDRIEPAFKILDSNHINSNNEAGSWAFNWANMKSQQEMIMKKLQMKDAMTEQEVRHSLRLISVQSDLAKSQKVVANMLANLGQMELQAEFESAFHPGGLKVMIDNGPNTGFYGKYIPSSSTVLLHKSTFRNKEQLVETFLHEMLHHHSSIVTQAWEFDPNNAEKYNRVQQMIMIDYKSRLAKDPVLMSKLESLDNLRKKVREQFKDTKDLFGPEAKAGLEYGTSSLTEFVAHVFTDTNMIRMLNSMKYDGKKTMLDHILQMFSDIWNAIAETFGVKEGTYLEESIRQVLDIITYDKLATEKRMNSNPVDGLSAFESFSMNHMMDENPFENTQNIDTIKRMIAQLENQRSELLGSYTGVGDKAAQHKKRRLIEELDEAIAELKESKDLAVLAEIGKRQLKWVRGIAYGDNSTANEIMTAIRMGNMWTGAVRLLFGENAESVDPELAQLAADAGNVVHRLISKSQDYITTQAGGMIRQRDWQEQALSDVSRISGNIRSLSSAAKSRVIQHIANFVETTGRHEDEDIYRLNKRINDLEKRMIDIAGGRSALKYLYDKMIRKGGWGLAREYAQKWFDWREENIRKRNAIVASIDKSDATDIEKSRKKRIAWEKFWEETMKRSTFVDTNVFFDAETGQYKKDIADAKAKLAKQVGEAHVNTILSRAQERYLNYIEHRNTYFDLLESELEAGEKTAEEVEVEKATFLNRHSPNVFFSQASKKSYGTASDRYVTFAPLDTEKEFWNDEYQEIKKDPKLNEVFTEYEALIEELLSYLPRTVQEGAGSGFLPAVRQALMSEGLDVKQYLQTFSERMTKSLTANEWQEDMNNQAFRKIPIQFMTAENEEGLSKDLIGIARLFGGMAIHYKHFSAAKDVIDMGEAILQEIEKSRMIGTSQMEQNGQIVTVKKGLRNALDALNYMKDYMVYRKPKDLEYSLGLRVFGKEGNYTLNPIELKRRSEYVKKLLAEKNALQEKFVEQEIDIDEYNKQLEAIDKELSKYEGMTLYGSKIGDKLIGINQLKALSYNPFSAVANLAFGVVSMAIHGAGGRDFTRRQALAGTNMMLKARVNKTQATKILNIMDRLGVIGDFVDSRYGKKPVARDNQPKWKHYADPFTLLKSTDYFMKGATTMAVLLNRKVKVTVEGVEKEINMYEALNGEGNWDAEKYGERPEWYSEDVTQQTEWDKLRNRVVRVNMVIHGNQDKNSPKMVNKTILGRLIGQFRMSWLPEGWYSRFQNERYDEYLERNVKGRYRTIGEVGVGGALMMYGKNLLNMIPGVSVDPFNGAIKPDGTPLADSEVDIENMKRNFAELSFYLGFTGAILMLKSLADDDDDKAAMVLQMMTNILIRGKQDLSFYASPSVFDAVTRNVIPATSVITDYWKFVKASGKLIVDDDYELEEWFLKMTKAGLPIPQATLINKFKFMAERDLDSFE